ncbi:MAG: hypothetical protein ACWA5K_05450, partial [bacterium]
MSGAATDDGVVSARSWRGIVWLQGAADDIQSIQFKQFGEQQPVRWLIQQFIAKQSLAKWSITEQPIRFKNNAWVSIPVRIPVDARVPVAGCVDGHFRVFG